jgi:hypothetical protein
MSEPRGIKKMDSLFREVRNRHPEAQLYDHTRSAYNRQMKEISQNEGQERLERSKQD